MYYHVEHPSFWVFLEGLKNFDASVDADINDLVNGKEINKRKKMWEAVQARKKTIVENYAPGNYLEYLQDCQHPYSFRIIIFANYHIAISFLRFILAI